MREWLVQVMDALGYAGIALLMFLENLVPPIPSEIVMPAAGFAARNGELSLWGCILAGTAGSIIGGVFWYFVAKAVGCERLKRWFDRYGRWVGLRADDVDTAVKWFERWGVWAVLVGRLVPGVRTLISVPAGFSQMPFTTFLLFSLIGTGIWTTVLTTIGWVLRDRYELVDQYLGPVAIVVLVGLGSWFAWAMWKRHRGMREQPA